MRLTPSSHKGSTRATPSCATCSVQAPAPQYRYWYRPVGSACHPGGVEEADNNAGTGAPAGAGGAPDAGDAAPTAGTATAAAMAAASVSRSARGAACVGNGGEQRVGFLSRTVEKLGSYPAARRVDVDRRKSQGPLGRACFHREKHSAAYRHTGNRTDYGRSARLRRGARRDEEGDDHAKADLDGAASSSLGEGDLQLASISGIAPGYVASATSGRRAARSVRTNPDRLGDRSGRQIDHYLGVMPQLADQLAPGSSRMRSVPDRKASGGHDIGSTAMARRRASGARVSPVKTMT